MSVMAAVCSLNVTKQNPEVGDQSFTFESPPPVAMMAPPEAIQEGRGGLMLEKTINKSAVLGDW